MVCAQASWALSSLLGTSDENMCANAPRAAPCLLRIPTALPPHTLCLLSLTHRRYSHAVSLGRAPCVRLHRCQDEVRHRADAAQGPGRRFSSSPTSPRCILTEIGTMHLEFDIGAGPPRAPVPREAGVGLLLADDATSTELSRRPRPAACMGRP